MQSLQEDTTTYHCANRQQTDNVAVLILRPFDNKVISVSRKKVHCHEAMYAKFDAEYQTRPRIDFKDFTLDKDEVDDAILQARSNPVAQPNLDKEVDQSVIPNHVLSVKALSDFKRITVLNTTTDDSTTAAELTEAYLCACDVEGFRNINEEIGLRAEEPTILYQVNQSAIQIAMNRGSLSKKTRAMEVRTLTYRNKVEDMKVVPIWVESKDMLADLGTKSLEPKPFISLRDKAFGYVMSFFR